MTEINNILHVETFIDGVDLVVFDLDDTLYSEKEYVRSGFKRISETLKMPTLESKLWEAFLQGQKAIDTVFESEKIPDRKDQALSIYRNQKPTIHLYSGVESMFRRIKQKGKKLGMLTDGRPEGQHAKIEALNLESIFDVIIITDELGGVNCRKPNEIGFQKLQEKTMIPFEKMVYIGDNIHKDFIAPEKLGMKCIFFNNCNGLYK